MKKKLISLVMAVLLVISAATPAFAETSAKGAANPGVHLMFTNTNAANATLNFYYDCAQCSGYVYGKSGTTKIALTGTLKQIDGGSTRTVKVWTKTVNSSSAYFSADYYVPSDYTYEFQLVATVYRNGSAETVTVVDRSFCRD